MGTYFTYLERAGEVQSQQHDVERRQEVKFENAKSGSAYATRLPNRGCG